MRCTVGATPASTIRNWPNRGIALASAAEPTEVFRARYGLRVPVLMAPMAGSSPSALAVAVANAGGMGGLGALNGGPAPYDEGSGASDLIRSSTRLRTAPSVMR
jgi:NAD(P)H-dependent flavin oxidoreductase YrpB (nitropropane dioxygenase family)